MLLPVLKSMVALLWMTLATLFCSKYFRELRIISFGHAKDAAKNLPHLKKHPLIYPCLKGQITKTALFFLSASRNRNVFGRHAAGLGLLGSIVFSHGS